MRDAGAYARQADGIFIDGERSMDGLPRVRARGQVKSFVPGGHRATTAMHVRLELRVRGAESQSASAGSDVGDEV